LIEFLSSFTQFILATFIPLYLGILFVILLEHVARASIRTLSAFALGLLFWFILDTLNDAIQLGVNEGFSFDFRHAGLLLLFIIGFLALALLSGLGMSDKGRAKYASPYPFLVAILAALGMGFHGIGEGMEFGGTSAGTSAIAILDAIGGYGGAVAYVLHKFLEATIVAVVFVALMSDGGLSFRKQLWRMVALGLTFGLPSAVGDVVGYFAPMDSSYFYALGGGAALFVALLVIRPIFTSKGRGEMTYSQWVGIVFALLLGFLSLYVAAAFHAG
jgi:hypothetical protein